MQSKCFIQTFTGDWLCNSHIRLAFLKSFDYIQVKGWSHYVSYKQLGSYIFCKYVILSSNHFAMQHARGVSSATSTLFWKVEFHSNVWFKILLQSRITFSYNLRIKMELYFGWTTYNLFWWTGLFCCPVRDHYGFT